MNSMNGKERLLELANRFLQLILECRTLPIPVYGHADWVLAKTSPPKAWGAKLLRDSHKVAWYYAASKDLSGPDHVYQMVVTEHRVWGARESWHFSDKHLIQAYAPHNPSVEHPGFNVSYGREGELSSLVLGLGDGLWLCYEFAEGSNYANRKTGTLKKLKLTEKEKSRAELFPYSINRRSGPISIGPHVFQETNCLDSAAGRIEELGRLGEVYRAFRI